MKVAGIIDNITSRTVSNGGTVFTALVDGAEVNLGFQCDYKEGEYAEIEVEQTKWGLQVPRKGSRPATGGVAGALPARVGSGATPRTGNTGVKQAFPVDPNTKDHSIIRQNALTNANTAVNNASACSKQGGFDTREEYYNEVIKVAYNLVGFGMGTLDAVLVEQQQLAEAKEAAATADAPAVAANG